MSPKTERPSFLESEPEKARDELLRRAAAKAADPETMRWAKATNSMLAAASADGSIKELLEQLGQ